MALEKDLEMLKVTPQVEYTIYIAGDLRRAISLCEEFCLGGFCVTCDPTTYIYKHGVEQGVKVGLINYARFPLVKEELEKKAHELGHKLLLGLNQGSFSVVGGGTSSFYSRRDSDHE